MRSSFQPPVLPFSGVQGLTSGTPLLEAGLRVPNKSGDTFTRTQNIRFGMFDATRLKITEAQKEYWSGQQLAEKVESQLKTGEIPYVAPDLSPEFLGKKAYGNLIHTVAPIFENKTFRDELLKKSDEFIKTFKKNAPVSPEQKDISEQLKLNNTPVTLTPCAIGGRSDLVYLKIGNQDYVLKWYPEPSRENTGQAYEDLATGLFLRVKDVPPLLMANPAEGWALFAAVPRNGAMPFQGTQITLQDMVNSGKVRLQDTHTKNMVPVTLGDTPNQFKEGCILAAYGSIRQNSQKLLQKADFEQAVAEFHDKKFLGTLLPSLQPELRYPEFCQLWDQYPEARHSLVSKLSSLPGDTVSGAMQKVFDTKASEGWTEEQNNDQKTRTAVRLYLLPTAEEQWKAYQNLIQSPDFYIRIGAAAAFTCLPKTYQDQGLNLLLNVFFQDKNKYKNPQTFLFNNSTEALNNFLFDDLQYLAPEVFIRYAHEMMKHPDPEGSIPNAIRKVLWFFDEPTRRTVWNILPPPQNPS